MEARERAVEITTRAGHFAGLAAAAGSALAWPAAPHLRGKDRYCTSGVHRHWQARGVRRLDSTYTTLSYYREY